MIRELVAAGIGIVIGYVAGVFFGYRAAVTDYVENDAENIETMADELYPSPSEEARQVSPEVLMERVEEDEDDEGTSATGGSRGFQ
jgi:hypothetical protein